MFPNVFSNVFHNPYSNHYHQVPNPRSNSTYDIPQGLTPGKQIIISGTANQSCDRFNFDLITRNGGVAFHLNPRFGGYGAQTVVRNSDLGGWGNEENSGNFPFRYNQPFDIVIQADHDKYRVSIDGQHAFDFVHRAPVNDVVRLGIKGDGLNIHRILFAGGDHGHGQHNHHHVNVPNVPFATPINRGPEPGRLIQISGQVPHHSNRFVVNLQNGQQQEPNEIPLHISVRFDDPASPQPVVVRTNRHRGSWGNEERDGGSPFARGAYFDLLILIERNEFKIAVNGQHFTSFRHRNSLHEANHVGIHGDVQIHSVRTF